MNVTDVEFNFKGSTSIFYQKLKKWMSSTEEGEGYKMKDTILEDILQKGRIIIKISYQIENPDVLSVIIIGYIKESNLLWILLLPIMCWCGAFLRLKSQKPLKPDSYGIQRRGWDDLISLLNYLEVENYKIRETGKNQKL